MLKLRRMRSKPKRTVYENSLPPEDDIVAAFESLGIGVIVDELSFTSNTTLHEFVNICNAFKDPGRIERFYGCRYPYMVRRGVQVDNDEPMRDLYVIDFGLMRAAISMDANLWDRTERISDLKHGNVGSV